MQGIPRSCAWLFNTNEIIEKYDMWLGLLKRLYVHALTKNILIQSITSFALFVNARVRSKAIYVLAVLRPAFYLKVS